MTSQQMRERATAALRLIAEDVRQHMPYPHAGNRACIAVVANLFDGAQYPLNLNYLRSLDSAQTQACLDIIAYDVAGGFGTPEIQDWGVIDREELCGWFEKLERRTAPAPQFG
ncbi:MAG: hypothetical protein WC809_07300 [Sinimarinibacterium sp.]|jgi:hypothetical protein